MQRSADFDVDVSRVVLAHEFQKALEADPLGIELVGGLANPRRDEVAHLGRHVADQCLEDRVLAVEIGVEATQRDPGPAGDPADRPVVESLFAELCGRSIERQYVERGLYRYRVTEQLQPQPTDCLEAGESA